MPENNKLYDIGTLMQTHYADTEFVKYMIGLFIKHMPESNANLEEACNEKNWEKVYFFAHKMKASIDLFDLEQLKKLIREVEQKAQKSIQINTIAKDVNFISDYIRRCVNDMKKDFNLT